VGDFDAAQVLAEVIHYALNPKGNDFQREARAVIAAIKADTPQGAELRRAIFGFGPAPALWDRLDKTAPTSAQMIEWYAPHTAELIHSEHLAAHARDMAGTATGTEEAALWTQIAAEIDGWLDEPNTADQLREDRVTSTERDAAWYEARRGRADDVRPSRLEAERDADDS